MKIPRDKQLHFAGGFIIALVTAPLSILYSSLILCTIAIGKEVYDKIGKGNCEILDAVATIAGGSLILFFRWAW